MNLIQYLKTASSPQMGAPVIAFFGDSVTHGAFESVQGDTRTVFDFDAVYHERGDHKRGRRDILYRPFRTDPPRRKQYFRELALCKRRRKDHLLYLDTFVLARKRCAFLRFVRSVQYGTCRPLDSLCYRRNHQSHDLHLPLEIG